MKLQNTMKTACLLPLTLLFACGAADESMDATAELADEPAAADEMTGVVATADVGYGTVYFHEQANDDGTVSIGVSELAPGNYATTPLRTMLAEGHTNLEVFLALVPNVEPPASYVDAHPLQAAELGRESDELRAAVFDADAPIEKSVTWCKNVATPAKIGEYAYTYSGALSMDEVYGSQALALNAGKKSTAPAICNEALAGKTSSHSVRGRVRMKKNGGSYDNPSWTPSLTPGWAWQWHGLQLLEYNCGNLPPGSICLPNSVDATYRLEGKSDTTSTKNRYDLYIAKIESVTFTGIIR